MRPRTLLAGLLLWTVGTVGIRLAGDRVLGPGRPAATLLLYLVSFVAMAAVIPGLCRRLGWDRRDWLDAASLLVLPTLILDPISCLFFPAVFPNVDPALAGAFGGWMLACCGGAVVGVWSRR